MQYLHMKKSNMVFDGPTFLCDGRVGFIKLDVVLETKVKAAYFVKVYFPLQRSVAMLKKDMEYYLKVPASCQNWFLKNRSITDSDTVDSLKAKPNDTIFVTQGNY